MKALFKDFLLPVGLLSGTIIGAGVFSLPYVFGNLSGTWTAGYLALAAAIIMFLHLLYGDLILRTPTKHNFVGYAREYLGNAGFVLGFLGTVVQAFFVLLIYIVLSLSFFKLVYPGISDLTALFVFWLFSSAAVFLSLRRMAFLEFLITAGMTLIFGVIFGVAINRGFSFSGVGTLNLASFLIPLGPVIFSLVGRVAIAETVEYFGFRVEDALKIKKVITWGTSLPAIVYFFFIVSVWTLSAAVSEDAVTGLVSNVSPSLLAVFGILGLLSLWSSYIISGLNLKNILSLDLGLPRIAAGLAVVAIPPALYALSFSNFIGLVSLIGGVFVSLEGLLILLMWRKANKTLNLGPVLLKGPGGWVFGIVAAVLISALIGTLFLR